jgi:hypothetical protein
MDAAAHDPPRSIRRQAATRHAWCVSASTNPGNHAKGQGRQHQDENGGTGLAWLFWLLPSAPEANCSHSGSEPYLSKRMSVAPRTAVYEPYVRWCGRGGAGRFWGCCRISHFAGPVPQLQRNNRTCRPEAMGAEMGHNPLASQKDRETLASGPDMQPQLR